MGDPLGLISAISNKISGNKHVPYKKKFSFEKREAEAARIRSKYPDRYPIVIEPHKDFPEIDKYKYLVPGDITVAEFIIVIRKRVKLAPEKAIFLHVGNPQTLAMTSKLMSTVFHEHSDTDGFLYIIASLENAFG